MTGNPERDAQVRRDWLETMRRDTEERAARIVPAFRAIMALPTVRQRIEALNAAMARATKPDFTIWVELVRHKACGEAI